MLWVLFQEHIYKGIEMVFQTAGRKPLLIFLLFTL
jgi:hypothetical protein